MIDEEQEVIDAARTVLERFEKDVSQGYVSRDKTYAISILRSAVDALATARRRGE